jgi:hypothetical protein
MEYTEYTEQNFSRQPIIHSHSKGYKNKERQLAVYTTHLQYDQLQESQYMFLIFSVRKVDATVFGNAGLCWWV